MDTILIIVFWLLFSLLVGKFAESRGRSFLGFTLLSMLVLSPVITFLVLLLLGKNTKAITAVGQKTCPACAEIIKAQAVVCHFCGFTFPARSAYVAPRDNDPLGIYTKDV